MHFLYHGVVGVFQIHQSLFALQLADFPMQRTVPHFMNVLTKGTEPVNVGAEKTLSMIETPVCAFMLGTVLTRAMLTKSATISWRHLDLGVYYAV